MKIQKQVSDKIGEKTYYKHVVVIPEEILEKAELKEGDELVPETKKGEIKLRKK